MLNPRATAGFTLIEVMVTVFVVAIGLLTAAGLQAVSKKAAIEATQRTTASVLGQDMLERLRSNPLQIDAYIGRDVRSNNQPAASGCGGNTGTACSPAQMVGFDYEQWWASLDGASEKIATGVGSATANAGGLRSPVGCVRRANGWIEVIIEWRGLSLIDQTPDSDNPADPTAATCGPATVQADWELNTTTNKSFRRVLRLQAHIQ
ncbi:MAG: type IV pilus modification protein PilV [Pseudomonadota bacterium]